jgi:hypothetical protein
MAGAILLLLINPSCTALLVEPSFNYKKASRPSSRLATALLSQIQAPQTLLNHLTTYLHNLNMDFVKNLTGGGNADNNNQQQQPTDSSKPQESSGGGLMDKVNGMAGGGQQGEKNEDFLDKGESIDPLQHD